LKLDRIRTLLGLLGDPHQRLRIVHVAGSKGKGSTSALLAAVLQHAGYRTGLFTSPHLVRVEERIQVAGQCLLPEELTSLMDEVRPAVEALDARVAAEGSGPTFFELVTALGFLHFARRGVEAAVVEVGLGGRFDSTNVCQPVVAVITSISLDHVQLLGDRLASIAMEKAGIVKPGRPVISGATAPEAREVIERISQERRAPLRQLGVDFHYRYQPGHVRGSRIADRGSRIAVVTRAQTWPAMELGLLGEHQAANAAVAVACVEQLRAEGWRIDAAAVGAGLATVSWPARMEVVGRRPLVVLDCAHNVASAQAVVDTLLRSFPPARRLLVFAGSSDKDLSGMLRLLAPHFAHAFLTRFGSPRSVPPEQLAELLRRTAELPCSVWPTAPEAWQAARALAGPDDLICITGSVFLAGELRPLLVR
jgi:dihydrofolate synthase/folylpolyglutamate synthase